MTQVGTFKRLLLVFACSLSACSATTGSVAGSGAMGAAAGAGTGALIGAVISRGDIPMSALAGAAIGLPLGLMLGYMQLKESEEQEEGAKVQRYIAKQEEIKRQSSEIEQLREEVLRDIPVNRLSDSAEKENTYTGPTLHNPMRY